MGSRVDGDPGCSACQRRYETLDSELVSMKIDEVTLTRSHEAALSFLESKSKLELDERKREYETLKADYDFLLNKVKFLQIPRDRGLLPADFLLRVRGLELLANNTTPAGAVQGAKSAVFWRMFECRPNLEVPTGVVHMDVSDSVMDAVINFCYTGEVCFGETVPPDEVLKLAYQYEIEFLRDVC